MTDAEKVRARRIKIDQWAIFHLASEPYKQCVALGGANKATFLRSWVCQFPRIAHSDGNDDVVNDLWLADDVQWGKIKYEMGYSPVQLFYNVTAPTDYVRGMDSHFHTVDATTAGAWTMVKIPDTDMPNFNSGVVPIYIDDVPRLLYGVGVHRSQRRA